MFMRDSQSLCSSGVSEAKLSGRGREVADLLCCGEVLVGWVGNGFGNLVRERGVEGVEGVGVEGNIEAQVGKGDGKAGGKQEMRGYKREQVEWVMVELV